MTENVLEEIMAENFPKTDTHTQEAQRVPNKMSPNRPTPRHTIRKMVNVKERILKAAREKQRINYKRTPPIRLSVGFSTETLPARIEWQEIFRLLKGKKSANVEYSTQQDYHLK